MALSENGNGIVMPVAPMSNGYGYGDGMGWGNGSFWIIVLFLFAMMGNGFGGGFGNNALPFMMNNNTNSDVQRGFDQQSVMSGINGLSAGINSVAQGLCSGFAGVNATVNTGFANAETAANARQIANMQQGFAAQTAIDSRLDSMAMTQQNCCCENRAATADVKYTVANEAATTRANTDAKVQMVLDKLCQLELDGVKQNYENRISGMQNTIDSLRLNLNEANRAASQTAQTAAILNDNLAQTNALEQYLAPVPRPAYVVQNPNCCGNTGWGSCGCNA